MDIRTNVYCAIVMFFSVFLSFTQPAFAMEPEEKLSWIFGFESKNGGDDMGALVVAGNDKGDVEAGSGMHFYLGFVHKTSHWYETRFNAGYHMDRSPTETGTVYMDRFPFELTPTFCYKNHRFGLGLTYHTNISLDGSDFNNPDITFEDSLGYMIEYGYKVTPFLFFGIRYVDISYAIENPGATIDGNREADASHFGINLYYQN